MLVVEDDPAVAAAVRRGMEYSGFTVTVVHDGPAALAHAARHLPDVVILDLGLPGLDGLAVCRRMTTTESAMTDSALGMPRAVRVVPSSGSTAMSTSGGEPSPMTSPL